MDILEFYGLKEDPFRLTPDPMYFFPSFNHNEALQSMNYVVEQKEGFCLVIGDPGTGKTTLLNVFIDRWKNKAEIAMILTPRLSPEEFLLSVLEDLNVYLTTTNKNEILRAFRDFLLEKSSKGRPVIIIVDEAQNLPDETLEELRLLSNLETDKDKLLQIILIAQPELEKRLNTENLRQLKQRITVNIRLNPLSINETLEYINYRLIKAGKGFLKLENSVLKPVYKFSAGIPRIINILSSRAIMSAYLDGSNTVKRKHIMYAVKHLKNTLSPPGRKIFWSARTTYAMSFLVLLIIGGAIGYNYLRSVKSSTSVVESKSIDRKDVNADFIEDINRKSSVQMSSHGVSPVRSEQKEMKEDKDHKKKVTVIVDSANLRSNPSLDAEKVTWASKGVVLTVIDEFTEVTGKRWYKVKTSDGMNCWIVDKVVTTEQQE
jgi:general secretion pathway protein A